MSKPSPQLNALNDTPFQSSPAFGQSPSKSDATTPPQEYPGSYNKRAKGKSPRLEELLQELEVFCIPCPILKGFMLKRQRRVGHRKKIGGRAGSVRHYPTQSYQRLSVKGYQYREHQLIWLWFTGEFPKQDIDHINGDGLDNRIENLRDVSRSVNAQNSKKRITNRTGVSGIRLHGSKYQVQLYYANKFHYGGTFATVEQAEHALEILKQELNEQGADFTDRHGR